MDTTSIVVLCLTVGFIIGFATMGAIADFIDRND